MLLSLLMAGLFAVVARQSWTDSSANSRLVGDEQQRVDYLRPLAHLIGSLTEAQSAAVRDAPVDAVTVQSAAADVDAADRASRTALGTGQRWTELRGRISAAVARPGTGAAAYQTFADILTLALDLVQRVGDTSDLVRDPQLDSYYVMDTVLLSLPRVMVSAGRAADLSTLAGKSVLSGSDAIQVQIARHDVAQDAADASAIITQSIEATGRPAMGADLAGQLDTFRAAVDQFAPLIILSQLTDPIDADSLPPAAGSVRVTALALGDAVLSELDAILADRDTTLARQRTVTIGVSIGALVVVLLIGWLALITGRGRPARRTAPDGEDGAVLLTASPEAPAPDGLTSIRDLPQFDELVHARMALRARHRGSDDHAG
jgi:hypothetical protein